MSSNLEPTRSSNSRELELHERKILSSLQDAEATESQKIPLLLNNLAVVYHAQGRFLDADVAHKRCTALLESRANDQGFLAQSLANRAALYRTFAQYHEAERLFQRATSLWDRHGWPSATQQRYNLEDAPETSIEKMLWADVLDSNGLLRYYTREVLSLKDNPQALEAALAKLGPWYHDLQLTPLISTYPAHRQYVQSRWKYIAEFLPRDLTGKRVLDIGCNGGFFSLQMKQLHAREVVGIDIMPHCLAQARFVSHWFAQPIELRELSAYDVASLGLFDIVVFIGVLYHLRYPLYAIDQVASICKEAMYLRSLVSRIWKFLNGREG